MLDSTSKIPVGLISLNFGEMGQFSECIRTESMNGLIHGKHCIGMFPLDMTASSSASTAENELVLRKRVSKSAIICFVNYDAHFDRRGRSVIKKIKKEIKKCIHKSF